MDELLTTAEAARELGVDPSRVRRLVLDGKLTATKRGRDLFIRRQDLDAMRDRKAGRPREERAEMTVYHTPSLPQHWIIRQPDGTTVLVPAIADGWAQRTPYAGPLRGLSAVAPQTARAALMLTGVPT